METMIVKYRTSAHTPSGWRPVEVLAKARPISSKMVEVIEVLDVHGHAPTARSASRTGAKRQAFCPSYVAGCEMGARKRLSALQIINIERN